MSAAGNTEVCWRRTRSQPINTKTSVYCSPMGSTNVFGTWLPRGGAAPPALDRDTVLVAARADGATMFDALAPDADGAVVGMVALLAVARALSEMPPPDDTQPKTNVMFMLFSGESFDYIGSDRMAYDMAAGEFPPRAVPAEDEKAGSVTRPPPLTLGDVRHYLELNQLARGGTGGRQLYLHSDPVSRAASTDVNTQVQSLVRQLLQYSGQYKLSMTEVGRDTPLPPSSLHALLRVNSSVPGVVVTDHAAGYTNSFFHSVYDVSSTVGGDGAATELVDHLSRVAQVAASAIYSLAVSDGAQPAPNVTVDKQWVGDLLECYLRRSNCSLFRDVMDEQMSDKQLTELWQKDVPLPTYVSVAGQATRHSYLMRLTKNLLSRWTGETLTNSSQADCQDGDDRVYAHRWLVRQTEDGSLEGYCTRSLVAESLAVSPAFFEIDDYDWSSGQHPSWAESQWVDFELRLFLKPSLGHELTHLLLGLAVTLLAIGSVLLLERRAHLVFDSPRLRPLRAAGSERHYGTLVEPAAT